MISVDPQRLREAVGILNKHSDKDFSWWDYLTEEIKEYDVRGNLYTNSEHKFIYCSGCGTINNCRSQTCSYCQRIL